LMMAYMSSKSVALHARIMTSFLSVRLIDRPGWRP
jgi:hypothetical protein